MGLDAVLELFPGDKRTDDFKAALGGLGVADMATLADAVVKGSGAVAQVDSITGRATELETKLAGAIIPPGENSTPDDISAYRQRIGVPTTITEYGLSEENQYVGALLKAGVRKEVAATLVSELEAIKTNQLQTESAASTAKYQATIAGLGENAEALITKGLEVLFPGEENLALRQSKAKDPDLAKAWHSVGRVSVENPRLMTNVDRGQATSSPYPSMDSRGIK